MSNLYGDYVDAGGNVVVKNVDVKKDARPAGTTFAAPMLHRITGGVGMHQVSSRAFPTVTAASACRKDGQTLLGQRPARHSGNGNILMSCPVNSVITAVSLSF